MTRIAAIKQNYDLAEWVEHDIGPPKIQSGLAVWCCPMHEESTPSFKIKPGEEHYHCYGCEAHGDIIDYVSTRHNLSITDAMKIIDGGRELTPEEKEATEQERIRRHAAREAYERERKEQLQSKLAKWQEARVWEIYNMNALTGEGLRLWENEGFEKKWVEVFQFGYAPGHYFGETMTIPYLLNGSAQNMKHRIVGADTDKYRWDVTGKAPNVYYAMPALPFGSKVYILEGEKKAAYTYSQLDGYDQCIGLHKAISYEIPESVTDIIYIPDPDTTKRIVWDNIVHMGKERVTLVSMRGKIDDMRLTKREILGTARTGRRF